MEEEEEPFELVDDSFAEPPRATTLLVESEPEPASAAEDGEEKDGFAPSEPAAAISTRASVSDRSSVASPASSRIASSCLATASARRAASRAASMDPPTAPRSERDDARVNSSMAASAAAIARRAAARSCSASPAFERFGFVDDDALEGDAEDVAFAFALFVFDGWSRLDTNMRSPNLGKDLCAVGR